MNDALLVNVVGLDAIRTTKLRKELRAKNIQLEVVKNSLARRATVERHHRARSPRGAGDLGAERVGVDRRYLDAVRAAVDRFVEALKDHGEGSILRVAFRCRKQAALLTYPDQSASNSILLKNRPAHLAGFFIA